MKEKLEKEIFDLREKFETLQRGKLGKRMRADVQECLRLLDAATEIGRRGAIIRKNVDDLVSSLFADYARIRLERRQRKMSAKATKKFWDEERGDR